MSNGKPKLTEEQFDEIWYACTSNKSEAKKNLITLGYMEKPETALERAERLYDEWEKSNNVEDNIIIIDMADAYREAIAEMIETIKHMQVG